MRLADARRPRAAFRAAVAVIVTASASAFTPRAPAGPQAASAQAASAGASAAGTVDVIHIDGAITPITQQQVERQIAASTASGAAALVMVMDTPGGLESAMRGIVTAILASRVPVITYVYPPGGRAASAGLFIVTSSHVAAMAPSTNIGAASPVSLGASMDSTMTRKVTNDAAALIRELAEKRGRNADWNERAVRAAVAVGASDAAKLHVVDFIAPDLASVLTQASGRRVVVASDTVTLHLAGDTINEIVPSLRLRILGFLAQPDIAYGLILLGFYGLIFELQSPGAILPGVAGLIFILLGAVAMQMLPVNAAGLALIVAGLAFFLLELKVQSHGMLAIGGVLAFAFGSLILFDPGPANVFRVSIPLIVGATGATAAFFLFAVGKAVAARRRPVQTGAEGLMGAPGTALTDLAPRGQVRVHGEIWGAESATRVAAGSDIQVTHVRGLTLVVIPRHTGTIA